MKSLKTTALATLLGLALASPTIAGTITGSRTTRTGTITGSSVGTITGSRTGTITGSRTGTITGSSVGTIPGSSAEEVGSTSRMLRDEIFSYALNALMRFAW